MKPNPNKAKGVTLEDLQKSACAPRNPHLFEKPAPQPKKAARISKNDSKTLRKFAFDISVWARATGDKLVTEHRFHEFRKFRFDFAFPDLMIAVEYEGGIFMAVSGHNTMDHYNKDVEKYNLAAEFGWTVLRFTAITASTVYHQLEKHVKNMNKH